MEEKEMVRLYVEEFKSTTDIAEISGKSPSTIRRIMIKHNCLRDQKTAHKLASHKMGLHRKGKTFKMSDEQKEKLRVSALKHHNKNAKGFRINSNGYIEFTRGEFKGLLLHSLLGEFLIGRKLKSNEVVHHKDENKLNNSLLNLEVMTRSKHSKIHGIKNSKSRIRNKKGQFN